jgi:LuxR family maltose regulon positive regulatory protein
VVEQQQLNEKSQLRRRAGSGDPRAVAPTLKQPAYIPGRLRDQLSAGLETGVLLVQAPAGYGKTTVVLQYLVESGIDPRWYTCVAEDSRPVELLSHLTRAIGKESPGCQTALAALASRDVAQSYQVALRPWYEELAESVDRSLVVVIDDADVVRAGDIAIPIFDDVLSSLANFARIIVISRADLSLPSQAKRMLDGRAVRIGAEDLLLREEDIRECASVSYGAKLSSDEVRFLSRVTGGWAIALRLALRLQGLGEGVRRADDAPFTPEARADLFAYLAAEVLSRVDERIERFLRQTAVLETLDPEVCARLAGEERAAELIQSLAGAGLPVMKAGWSSYRSHSLLREYFLRNLSDDELHEAHRLAGLAYQEIGDWSQALTHFVAAGDTEHALAIVDEHGRELFFTRHGRAVLDLVKNAPLERLEEHYWAHYWAGFAAARMFELDWAIDAFERVHASAVARGDTRAAQDALRAQAHTLNGWARFEPALAASQRLLDSVPEDDRAGRAAVTLGYLTTGMGGGTQFSEAIDLVRKLLPELSIEPRTDPAAEGYARAVASATLAFVGDHSAARAELHLGDVVTQGIVHDDIVTFLPWSRALVEFLAGNTDGAEEAARNAERLALQFGDLQRVLECRAILASVTTWRGDVEAADREFAQLDELRAGGTDHWGTVLTLLSRPHRARLHGDFGGALVAAEANHALAVATSSVWFICSTHLDVAYFRLLNGDAETARDHARTALDDARALSAGLLAFGAHMMIAVASPDEEAKEMAEALRIAEERDFRFLVPFSMRLPQLDAALWRALATEGAGRAAILLHGTGSAAAGALAPLLTDLPEKALINAVEVLRSYGTDGRTLLGRLAGSSNRKVSAAAKGSLAALESANPYGLSPRELDVLRLLAQGLRTKEIAEQLVLTPATISTHLQRIMNKTGTASRAELLALAVREATAATS